MQPHSIMNRLILLIVTSASLIAAFNVLTDFPHRQLTLVDILPQETVALLESKNIAQAYGQMRQGLVGRALARPDFSSYVQQLGLPKEQLAKLLSMRGTFNQLAQKQGLLSLFSRESMVALLPTQSGERITLDHLGTHLVFLQYFPSAQDWQQLFSRSFGPIAKVNTTEFQGQPLTSLTFEQGETLTYFTHEGMVVWAFNRNVLYPCVNQLLQQLVPLHAGIQKYMGYTRLKKLAGHTLNTFAYIRINALKSLLGCPGHQANADQLPCPSDLALFSTSVAKGNRFVVVALADAEKIAAYKSRNHLDDAVENAPLGRLSTNTAFALWTNWFKPNLLRKQLLQSGFSPVQTLLTGWSDDLSKAFGVSLADFFALFGSEFSLYIDQFHAPHQYPRSMVSMAIEVHDSDQVDRLLHRMTNKLQKVEVLSGGLKIVTLLLADGLLQPAYSFIGHYLILADSVDLVERIHEKMIHPEVRIDQSRGLQVHRGNFFLFLRTGDMVEWLLPVLTTLGKEFGGHSGDGANDGLLLQPLTLSALSDLKQIEKTRIRGYMEKDELFLEVVSFPAAH